MNLEPAASPKPSMRLVDAGNARLEVWDEGTGPLLLFIHGVATSGQMWATDLANLAGDVRAKASEARREQLLANRDGLFADLASGGGTIDERVLGTIGVPVTIVDASLSPSFLRRSSDRLKRMLPQASNVTLAHSGHWVALDARDDLLRILRDAAH